MINEEPLQTGNEDEAALNAEAVEVSTPESQEAEPAQATGTDGEQDKKVKFTPEQQKVFDDNNRRMTEKRKNAEREAEKLRQEIEDLRSKLPEEKRPTVPPMPNPNDLNFETLVAEREDKLREAVKFDLQEESRRQQALQQEEQSRQAAQETLVETVTSYTDRAVKLGIKKEDLRKAGDRLEQEGFDNGIVNFILKQPQGPLVTMYLDENPDVSEALAKMDAAEGAAYIATEILPKAAQRNVKINDVPNPDTPLNSGGIPVKERGPEGATFV